MELRNVISFLRVTELGSFSKAAESMGYAQSTVTMQIQQLEEELGKPLFDRFGRTVSLTDFGETYLPLARQMYDISLEMQTLSSIPTSLSGTLKVGIIESIFYSNFQNLIHKYRAQFPKVTLDFQIASSTELYELLFKNKVDIICCLTASLTEQKFITLLSKPVLLVFVCNRTNRLANCHMVSLEQLAQESFILTEEISVYHQILLKLFADHRLPLQQSIRLKSTRGIVEVLQHNDDISFLPEYVVRREVTQGYLKIIHTNVPRTETTALAAVHKDKWISPQMRGMIHLLQNENWL